MVSPQGVWTASSIPSTLDIRVDWVAPVVDAVIDVQALNTMRSLFLVIVRQIIMMQFIIIFEGTLAAHSELLSQMGSDRSRIQYLRFLASNERSHNVEHHVDLMLSESPTRC